MIFSKAYNSQKTTRFTLVEDYRFTHVNGEEIVIPKGYSSDFASVPRLLWWLIPPHGHSSVPSVVHDYLYDNKIGTRLEADLKFYHDLAPLVPVWQAFLMFMCVRLFAKSWWEK